MIAKYDGRCWRCGWPTKGGVDHYDPSSKQTSHAACVPVEESDEEAEQFAERLGYRPHEEWFQ